jgi:general secretion pathway protein L
MPNTLFIRPNRVHHVVDATFEWALYDIAGEQIKYGARTTLDMIDQTLMQNGVENVDLVALWPSFAAFSTKISLPGNQTRFVQQALPFAVEDQVAQDIEQIHIALGAKSKGGDFPVVCSDKSLFSAFFDSLTDESAVGPLKAIHLDAELLPRSDQRAVLCISSDGILLKTDQNSVSLSVDNLIPFLDSVFLGQTSETDKDSECNIHVYVAAEFMDQAKMLIAQIEQYPGASVTVEQIGLTQFELLCENYFRPKTAAINLCQGDYQIESQSAGLWHKWRSVALVAGIGFLLQLGVFIGQGVYLNKQADKIGQLALSKYQQVVPGSKKVSLAKLPRIMKGKMNQKNAGSSAELDFMTLLGEAGYHFKNNSNRSSLSFKSINYNEQRGELVMEMQAKSFQQLESLKQAIVSAGLSAKISSAVQEKDYFRGRISVGGA